MNTRDQRAREAVSGAYGVSYAVARDGAILAMSGAHCHGAYGVKASNENLTFVDWDLFSVIQGAPVRAAYRSIHEMVIGQKRTVTFDYRCDAPDLVRHMTMTISPISTDDGSTAALYQSQVRNVRRRLPLAFLKPGARRDPGLPTVRICAWCAKVNTGDDAWLSAEQYAADTGATEVRIGHDVCPACSTSVVGPLLCEAVADAA